MRALTKTLAAALLAAPLVAAPATPHDPAACEVVPGAQAFGSALSKKARLHYFGFFGDVVGNCALDIWSELVSGVQQLGVNQFTQSEVDALYVKVAARLPAVRVRWDGSAFTVVSAPGLELTRGLEQGVLVEIENTGGIPIRTRAWFLDQPKPRPGYAPAGGMLPLLARIRVDSPRVTQTTLVVQTGALFTRVALPLDVHKPALILGTTIDSDLGTPFPARVRVTGSDGLIRQAQAVGGNSTLFQKSILGVQGKSYRLPFTYTDGSFQVLVPPGPVTIELERGFEHKPVTQQLTVFPAQAALVTLSSGRFVDMQARGWISGETHVHWVKNWWYENEDIDLLAMVQRAEDVRVVNNLSLRHYWNATGGPAIAANQAPMGPVPGHAKGDYVIHMGEEFRNDPYYGHLNFLNLTSFGNGPVPKGSPPIYSTGGLVLPVSTGNPLGKLAEDYPTNATRIDWALRQEPAESRPVIISAHGIPGAVPADLVQGRIDSLDQMPLDDYYRVLDAGLRVPLTDGADHPARRVGEFRCYVKVAGAPTYGGWIDGILSGATFSTSGPLILFQVNDVEVGGEVRTVKGEHLSLSLEIHSRHPIGRYQIVSNGDVLIDRPTQKTSTTVNLTLPADESRWIVARCSAAAAPTFRPGQELDAAHTSAVYVVVDGKDIYVNSGAAQTLRDRCQAGGDGIFNKGVFYPPNAAAKRAEARDWFYAGRDAYQAIIDAH